MIPRPNRIMISFTLALLLLFFGAGLAAPASSQALSLRPVFQETYPYPLETYPTDVPYPGEVTLTPTKLNLQATATPTLKYSPTPDVNVFATENAEMGSSLGTQAASATSGPSITPADTQTGAAISTATPALAASGANKKGFSVNWGYFWIGFAVPVLVACGVVLYLLDRRPELFTQRTKS